MKDEVRGDRSEERKLVRDAMSTRVASVGPEASVTSAAARLAEQEVGVLAVCDDERRLRAVLTDRDIVVRTVAQGLDPERLSAGEAATEEPVTISPSATLQEAAGLMGSQQVRRLPVTQGGRVVGMISEADLAAHGAGPRVGRLLARLAQRGDRRTAGWLLRRPYREADPRTQERHAGRARGAGIRSGAVALVLEMPRPAYLGGLGLGIGLAAALLLGPLGPLGP